MGLDWQTSNRLDESKNMAEFIKVLDSSGGISKTDKDKVQEAARGRAVELQANWDIGKKVISQTLTDFGNTFLSAIQMNSAKENRAAGEKQEEYINTHPSVFNRAVKGVNVNLGHQ